MTVSGGPPLLPTPLAVEVLVFEVEVDALDEWLAADHELWTIAETERFPALVHKEVWVAEGDPHRVTVVIHWDDLEAWKSIPKDWIDAQEQVFSARVGAENYRLISAEHEERQAYKITEFRR